jgi:NAD(P)-dependent dehydrogenase (short-subunit alcohol dehydrogenase family)
LEHGQNGDQFGLGHNVTATNRMFSLDGRVALITGASRGLGLAMAEGLAEAGATVVANGRSADTLEEVVRALRERGLKADTSPFDVTDHRAAQAAIDVIIARYGRLDILIANAGINHRVALADWTPADWDRLIAANLKACFFLAQHAAVSMRREKQGRIIFTTSIAGILGLGKVHGYTVMMSANAPCGRCDGACFIAPMGMRLGPLAARHGGQGKEARRSWKCCAVSRASSAALQSKHSWSVHAPPVSRA